MWWAWRESCCTTVAGQSTVVATDLKSSSTMPAFPCLHLQQALERQRLKRMRGAGGDDDEFGSDDDDATAPLGGFALRRHKAARAVRVLAYNRERMWTCSAGMCSAALHL